MLMKLGVWVAIVLVGYRVLSGYFKADVQANVDGEYLPAFKPVFDKLRENVASGKEPGCAFSVYHKGQSLLHIWGGYADKEAQRSWKKDTVTQIFSTTKGVAAIVIAKLVGQGYLDYKRPIGDYWPEFKQNGKEAITVEMLLTHTAGIPILDTPITMFDVRDNPTEVEKILAEQKTYWTPGTARGYHTLTYGIYLDTLVRKVDPKGRTMDQIFFDEIRTPFGIDMFMNLPRESFYRAARLYGNSPMEMIVQTFHAPYYLNMMRDGIFRPESLLGKSGNSIKDFNAGEVSALNNPEIRAITMYAAMGSGSAAGLAKLFSILAGGGQLDGKRLLTEETIAKLFTPISVNEWDLTISLNVTYARGLYRFERPEGHPRLFGHPGHGGQIGMADLDTGLGFGYITNYIGLYGLGDDPRALDLLNTFYDCFKKYQQTEV